MLALGTIGLFLKSNFKAISYVVIAIIIASATYKLYSIIDQNGQYKASITILEENIKLKDNQIDSLREAFKLTNELVTERDKELKDLIEKMRDNLTNLGVDADDQAPESLKEYFRRLGSQ